MRTEQLAATYDRLRREPAWTLLCATSAPEVLALLRHLLYERDRALPGSVLHERLTTELAELRRQGRDVTGTASRYLDQWVSAGWLDRRLPDAAAEDEYELSVSTLNVFRALDALHTEREAATETRLSLVVSLMQQLARDTDSDPTSRLEELYAQKRALERQIDAALAGQVEVLSEDRVMERVREVYLQSRDVNEDFRRCGLRFTELYRNFRERAVSDDRTRGQLLADVFNEIDVIAESHSGKTFAAFYRLLTDPESMATLEASIDAIMARDFIGGMPRAERLFLQQLPQTLLNGASAVADLRTGFARSLRAFVVRREWDEHRRLIELLTTGKKAALGLRDLMRPEQKTDASLALTSATFGSIGTWKPFEPKASMDPADLSTNPNADVELDDIANDIFKSDIDFRSLADSIRELIHTRGQCTVRDLVDAFSAPQGLGTIIGYIDLGTRHGEVAKEQFERLTWIDSAGNPRSATVPLIYFLPDCAETLCD